MRLSAISNQLYERFFPSPPNRLPREVNPPPTLGTALMDSRFITHKPSIQVVPRTYDSPVRKLDHSTKYHSSAPGSPGIVTPLKARSRSNGFLNAIRRAKC